MLFNFIYQFVDSYGLAVIVFALLTKLILLPFSYKSKKGMQKMSALSAKQQALQKKYGNNRVKLNEEMQKLYEKEGVSPMSGCLPSFLPLPIMMGLYYVIEKPITFMMGIADADFMDAANNIPDSVALLTEYVTSHGLADLSSYTEYNVQIPIIESLSRLYAENGNAFPADLLSLSSDIANYLQPINFDFFGINLAQTPNFGDFNIMWLIPILSGATALLFSFISQKLQKVSNPNAMEAQGSMKLMLYLTPLMSVYFGFLLPAALGVYWIVNNIFSICSETALTFYMAKKNPPPEPEKKAKKPHAAPAEPKSGELPAGGAEPAQLPAETPQYGHSKGSRGRQKKKK